MATPLALSWQGTGWFRRATLWLGRRFRPRGPALARVAFTSGSCVVLPTGPRRREVGCMILNKSLSDDPFIG